DAYPDKTLVDFLHEKKMGLKIPHLNPAKKFCRV
ncbi:unnamed protein product, partial [marine sediment metagenome]